MRKKLKYRIGVYSTYLMEWMAQRASMQHKNYLDQIIISILNRLVSTKHLKVDYMADDLIESAPEFSIEELEDFENEKSV
ncbi:MAG: hypothetical protein AAF696_31655 [Bacteroidota bacterium]